jgi:hypothetical protein
VFRAVLGELVDARVEETEDLEELASDVLDRADAGLDALADAVFDVHKIARGPGSGRVRAKDLHKTCMSFVELIDRMGDIFTATPGLTPAPGVWTVDDYDQAQRDVNQHLRDWLKKTGVFRGDGEAHPRTIAFIGTLAALAGVAVTEQRSVMSLTMTRRGDTPETVTLC